jgi:hypothetical protein
MPLSRTAHAAIPSASRKRVPIIQILLRIIELLIVVNG